MKFVQFGPKKSDKDTKIGGVIVAYEIFAKNFKADFHEVNLNTNNSRFPKFFETLLLMLRSVFSGPKKGSVVIFHATANALILLGPFFLLRKKIFSSKLVLRKFAGNFDEVFEKQPELIKKLIVLILKNCDICYFETFKLVNYFKKYNENTFRLPNLREESNIVRKERPYCKKFVFISQIKVTKGVQVILDSFSKLGLDYSIDFYGPILDKHLTQSLNTKNTKYKGVLEPSKVSEILSEYDVILLPTFHEGEGYPGVIIEGFSMGIPSVSTLWNSIPELVKNESNGWLIEPQNIEELTKCITSINVNNYERVRKQARLCFSNFEANSVVRKCEEFIFSKFS